MGMSLVCQSREYSRLRFLRFWALNSLEGFNNLNKYKGTWEYKIQREKERQLVQNAKEQNAGSHIIYNPRIGKPVLVRNRLRSWGKYHVR